MQDQNEKSIAIAHERIKAKLKDSTEILDGIINIAYPYLLQPIPSMTILSINIDQDRMEKAILIPKHTIVKIDECIFRTANDHSIIPAKINSVEFKNISKFKSQLSLRLNINSENNTINTNQKLKFYINIQGKSAYELYEMIFENCEKISIKCNNKHDEISNKVIREVGFSDSEEIIPYDKRVFQGHRLLTEYFAFTRKFLFFEIDLSQKLDLNDDIEAIIFFNKANENLEEIITNNSLLLNCVPIINIFSDYAEPIFLNHKQSEYQVLPNRTNNDSSQIFSVKKVSGVNAAGEVISFLPMYKKNYFVSDENCYWYYFQNDQKSHNYSIAFSDKNMNKLLVNNWVINCELFTTNGNKCSKIQSKTHADIIHQQGDLIENATLLCEPTQQKTFSKHPSSNWDLIASMFEKENFCDKSSLNDLLLLFSNVGDENQQIIAGSILDIKVNDILKGKKNKIGAPYILGKKIILEFDESNCAEFNYYMFGKVMFEFYAKLMLSKPLLELMLLTKNNKININFANENY